MQHIIINLTVLYFYDALASITHAQTDNYTFVKSWGSSGSGDGQFSHPHCVAVDSSGNVYVADSGNYRI